MEKPLSILFVASEVFPFAKVGGVADIAFSLPLALREYGHDVRVMLPRYGCVSERKYRIHEINRLRDMSIPINNTTELATVKSSSIQNARAKVQAYITTNEKYFNAKKGIYSNPKTGKEYPDNDERFIFFCRSVIDSCRLLQWYPDVIHCNDWQTAMVPAYAKVLFPEEFKNTKIVFTIHNFSQQGEFPLESFDKTGLPGKAKTAFTHNKKLNFMKAAIKYADFITTVSKTYAEDILKDSKYSNGLNAVLKKEQKKFKGILNGLDIWTWNPKRDKLIKKKYSNKYNEYKSANKAELLKRFDLQGEDDTPVIAMITRLDEHKGIPLLLTALPEILKNDVRFVLLGEGQSELKKQLKLIAQKYESKMSIKFEFEEELAHLVEAGSDIYLLPSLYEPFGLNALYSLSYGVAPVVHATGGLIDIVKEFDTKKKKGNGFVFTDFKPADFVKAVNRALDIYKNKELWEKLIENGMSANNSWAESVVEYDNIYNS